MLYIILQMVAIVVIGSNAEERTTLVQDLVGKPYFDSPLNKYELDSCNDVPTNVSLDNQNSWYSAILIGDTTMLQEHDTLLRFSELDVTLRLVVITGTGGSPHTIVMNGINTMMMDSVTGNADVILATLFKSKVPPPVRVVYTFNDRAFTSEASVLDYAKRNLGVKHILASNRDIGWDQVLEVSATVFDVHLPEQQILTTIAGWNMSQLDYIERNYKRFEALGYEFEFPLDEGLVVGGKDDFDLMIREFTERCCERFEELATTVEKYNDIMHDIAGIFRDLYKVHYTITEMPLYD
jgi:hypothetical protein